MSQGPGKPYVHVEYPKWVNGVLCQNAEEEAALAQVDKQAADKAAAVDKPSGAKKTDGNSTKDSQ